MPSAPAFRHAEQERERHLALAISDQTRPVQLLYASPTAARRARFAFYRTRERLRGVNPELELLTFCVKANVLEIRHATGIYNE